MENNNLDISVIIPTYNRVQKLAGVLEAWRNVLGNTSCTFEIVFSDDGSEDNTVETLKACTDLPIKIVENEHGGAASARNNAIKRAIGGRIIFVGDDIYPEPDFIQKHYECGKEYGNNVAILGAVDWHPEQGKNYLLEHIAEVGNEQFSFNRLKPDSITDFRHFYTCNVSVSSEMLNKEDIKFDERFYKVNFEDIELAYRLRRNGMKILYKPDIFGYHYHEYMAEKFCIRQSTAGEMAVVFTNLHPEVDSMLGVSKTTDAYSKYKDAANASKSDIDISRIVKVIGVCNDLESELLKNIDIRYEVYIKQILSILYERSFRYKYHEGILRIKYPGEVESIDKYLTASNLDRSMRDALMAEYYIGMDKNVSLMRLLFGNKLSRKDPVASRIQLNIKEVVNKIFDADIDGARLYSVNRQLIINRVKAHLKKYYLLRQLKYKYDSIRRTLFFRA